MTDHVHDEAIGIICRHVRMSDKPLVEVWHDPDSVYQFLCGADDHSVEELDPICPGCAFIKHVDGLAAADLAPAYVAERATGDGRWMIRAYTDEELNDEDE